MRPSNAFRMYAAHGFGYEILPVIPPGAKLSPGSNVDPSQRAKIPGVYNPRTGTWHGMREWSTRQFTVADHEEWDTWPICNVGLRARYFPAVDIDVEDPVVVNEVKNVCFKTLGKGPIRGRQGSARILLPYRLTGSKPFPKKRIVFTMAPGGEKQAVEFLGAGCQYLIYGLHPSGATYVWTNGDGQPIDIPVFTETDNDGWGF